MYYWPAFETPTALWHADDWNGDYVVYAPLTLWPSKCDWIVPGTWRDN